MKNYTQVFNPLTRDVVRMFEEKCLAEMATNSSSQPPSYLVENLDEMMHYFALDCILKFFFQKRFYPFSEELRGKLAQKENGPDTSTRDSLTDRNGNPIQLTPVDDATGPIFENPEQAKIFVHGVTNIFRSCLTFFFVPIQLIKWLRMKTWLRFREHFTDLYSIVERLIGEKMEMLQEDKDAHRKDISIVTQLLALDDLTPAEIASSVVDIMGGAVDTTATALQWAFYLLAKNPDKQEILFDEVCKVVGDSKEITWSHLERMPYLKATVKELLRLYPVIPLIGRIVSCPITVNGVNYPKGTKFNIVSYAAGRSEEIFQDSEKFIPERWIRNKSEVKEGAQATSQENAQNDAEDSESQSKCPFSSSSINKYGTMPFGLGVRSCIGRRIAQLELYLFIANLVRRFKIKPPNGDDFSVGDKWQILLLPDSPVKVRLESRFL